MFGHITFQDGTRYRQVENTETLVRDPLKVNGRDRKRRRKLVRRRIGKPGLPKTQVVTGTKRKNRSGWVIH
jgi:hypothetical protein